MFLTIAFVILESLFGLSIFHYLDSENKFSLPEYILSAVATGVILGSFIILVLALVTGSLNIAIILFCIIALTSVIYHISVIKKIYKSSDSAIRKIKSWRDIIKPWVIILLIIFYIYYSLVSSVLFRDEGGNLKSALVGWGDTALHVSLIQRFATADPFLLEHPLMGGANLTYPFLVDFISGIYLKFNPDIVKVFVLPLYLLGFIWIVLLFCVADRVLKSKLLATFVLLLIMFGSGFGFTVLYKDLKISYAESGLQGIQSTLKSPPHEYTHLNDRTGGIPDEKVTKDNIVWIVPLISFFAHQRSFTLGLTIFVLILLGIYHYGFHKNFWRYGVFVGILPFSHGHTLLAVFLIMAVLFWYHVRNWKSWIMFAFIAGVMALPQMDYFQRSSSLVGLSSFKPYFGWMTCDHSSSWLLCEVSASTDTNAFIFWSKNFGLIFLLWALILVGANLIYLWSPYRNYVKEKFHFKFIFASLLIFAASNLLLFQPWSFDNNKVLFYWWLLAIIFVIMPMLKILWEEHFLGKYLVIITIIFSIISGSVDTYARITRPKNEGYYGYTDGSKENQEIGEWIKKNTRPNDLFLANPGIDEVPVFLAGRPIYLAFEGWLWSEGLDYSKNRDNIQKILLGNLDIACEQNIKYILYDIGLKNTFPSLNEKELLSKTIVVYDAKSTYSNAKILEVKCL